MMFHFEIIGMVSVGVTEATIMSVNIWKHLETLAAAWILSSSYKVENFNPDQNEMFSFVFIWCAI